MQIGKMRGRARTLGGRIAKLILSFSIGHVLNLVSTQTAN